MQWSGERNGEYTGTLADRAPPGWYEARIEATRGGTIARATTVHVRAAPGDAEYFDATMHAATLRRIAEETGGSSTRRRPPAPARGPHATPAAA